MTEAERARVDFAKGNGLAPAVVQNYATAWALQGFIDARRAKEVEGRAG